MRRTRTALVAAGVATLGLAGVAHADKLISAAPSNRFTPSSLEMAPGERLTFRNGDVVSHDVTARKAGPDGKPLFATPLVDPGRSANVDGARELQPGTYQFFCSVHPAQMEGTLTVTGTPGATPTPTPTPGSAEDNEPPEVTLSGSFRAAAIRSSRRLTVRARSNEKATLDLTAKIGTRRVGRVTRIALPKGSKRITLQISRSARSAIRAGRKLTLSAVATDTAGNRRRSSLSVRLP